MKQSIIVVDYGMGNLNSVKRKLFRIGVNACITNDPLKIANADKLILPGVGHFGKAMQNLARLDLVNALNKAVLVKKNPILGICLGMQLMAVESEEGHVAGFGWLDARVVKFKVKDSFKYKVPHTGWNHAIKSKESLLLNDIPENSEFYFVHAYHFECNNQPDVLTETDYEYRFISSVEKYNIFGVQFHPEKSHDIGEKLLKNFVNL